MAWESFRITTLLPADPHQVYEAWLDSEAHAAFTGHPASIDPVIGGHFRAGDGYYQGHLLWLDPGRLIVKTFRTAEFPTDARPSVVEVRLHPNEAGTLLELDHKDVPQGLRARFEEGWVRHYFEPLGRWLASKTGGRAPHVTEGAPSF